MCTLHSFILRNSGLSFHCNLGTHNFNIRVGNCNWNSPRSKKTNHHHPEFGARRSEFQAIMEPSITLLTTVCKSALIVGERLLTLWLAAHFVHAAAGTNTAADEDEQNDDRADNTKDHVHWCGMIENRLGFTEEETKKKNSQKQYVLLLLNWYRIVFKKCRVMSILNHGYKQQHIYSMNLLVIMSNTAGTGFSWFTTTSRWWSCTGKHIFLFLDCTLVV